MKLATGCWKTTTRRSSDSSTRPELGRVERNGGICPRVISCRLEGSRGRWFEERPWSRKSLELCLIWKVSSQLRMTAYHSDIDVDDHCLRKKSIRMIPWLACLVFNKASRPQDGKGGIENFVSAKRTKKLGAGSRALQG